MLVITMLQLSSGPNVLYAFSCFDSGIRDAALRFHAKWIVYFLITCSIEIVGNMLEGET